MIRARLCCLCLGDWHEKVAHKQDSPLTGIFLRDRCTAICPTPGEISGSAHIFDTHLNGTVEEVGSKMCLHRPQHGGVAHEQVLDQVLTDTNSYRLQIIQKHKKQNWHNSQEQEIGFNAFM